MQEKKKMKLENTTAGYSFNRFKSKSCRYEETIYLTCEQALRETCSISINSNASMCGASVMRWTSWTPPVGWCECASGPRVRATAGQASGCWRRHADVSPGDAPPAHVPLSEWRAPERTTGHNVLHNCTTPCHPSRRFQKQSIIMHHSPKAAKQSSKAQSTFCVIEHRGPTLLFCVSDGERWLVSAVITTTSHPFGSKQRWLNCCWYSTTNLVLSPQNFTLEK